MILRNFKLIRGDKLVQLANIDLILLWVGNSRKCVLRSSWGFFLHCQFLDKILNRSKSRVNSRDAVMSALGFFGDYFFTVLTLTLPLWAFGNVNFNLALEALEVTSRVFASGNSIGAIFMMLFNLRVLLSLHATSFSVLTLENKLVEPFHEELAGFTVTIGVASTRALVIRCLPFLKARRASNNTTS